MDQSSQYQLTPEAELDHLLGGIEETCKEARTLLFVLTTTSAFVLIAAFSQVSGQSIKLPIIGNEIPPEHFFTWSPLVLLSVYLYLQVYIQELRGRFDRLYEFQSRVVMSPPMPRDLLFPWLFVIALQSKRESENPIAQDQFARVSPQPSPVVPYLYPLAVAVVWLLGPLVLALLWIVFLRDQKVIALLPCIALIVSSLVALRSIQPARFRLASIAFAALAAAALLLTLASVPALREKTYLATLWNLRHALLRWSSNQLLPFVLRGMTLLIPLTLVGFAARYLYQIVFPLRVYRRKLARALERSIELSGISPASSYVPLHAMLRSKPNVEIAAEALLDYTPTALILGDPGSGKTTLLTLLALRLATKQWGGLDVIPVFIRLVRFGLQHDLFKVAMDTLVEYGIPHPERLFMKLASRGRIAFLLDALDELTPEDRDHAVRDIRSLIEQFPSCIIYITSRIAGYKGELDDAVRDILTISPISTADVELLVRQRFASDEPEANRMIREFMEISPKLAGNPLLVAMAAAVFMRNRRFSRSEDELIDQLVKSRLDYWDRARQVNSSLTLREKMTFLEALALEMENNKVNEVSDEEYLKLADAMLRESGDPHRVPELLAETTRSGLIVAANGHVGFVHRSIQDYFVKSALQEQVRVK